MAKAARVLAALQRDGWMQIRQRGSHRVLLKDGRVGVFAHHHGTDLGGTRLAQVAQEFGYTVAELQRMV